LNYVSDITLFLLQGEDEISAWNENKRGPTLAISRFQSTFLGFIWSLENVVERKVDKKKVKKKNREKVSFFPLVWIEEKIQKFGWEIWILLYFNHIDIIKVVWG